MDRSTFVDDQLTAAAADTQHRLRALLGRHPEQAHAVQHHPAEAAIAQRLVETIAEGRISLCEHLSPTAPSRCVWSPGMTALGCQPCFVRFAAATVALTSCDCCAQVVRANEGRILFAIGPVTVVATICPACAQAPSTPAATPALIEATRDVASALQQLWDAA